MSDRLTPEQALSFRPFSPPQMLLRLRELQAEMAAHHISTQSCWLHDAPVLPKDSAGSTALLHPRLPRLHAAPLSTQALRELG